MNIIIASNRPFPNRDVQNNEQLSNILDTVNPQYILFPFWSWKVPKEITDKYHCIGFHTGNTNGGSPIQNLIKQGVEDTIIRVFKMNDKIDGGDNLDVIQVSLLGNLEEIIIRMTDKIDGYIQTHYR
jgi:methionyl-tRNA formyltransferase